MQAVTKMADLTKFRQTDVEQRDDFYANYITRDGANMLANLTILAIFYANYIMSYPNGADNFDEF